MSLALQPKNTLQVIVGLYGEVACVIRGGLTGEGLLINKAMLEPRASLMFKGGVNMGGKLDVVFQPIELTFNAVVDNICVKWCSKFGVEFPCGLKWCRLATFELLRFEFPSEEVRFTLLEIDSWPGDKTPPTMGNVTLSQIDRLTASATFSGFSDEDNEITDLDLFITTDTESQDFYQAKFSPTGSWRGTLSRQPDHGSRLKACVTAFNGAGLTVYTCSKVITWDTKPPVLLRLQLFDLITEEYTDTENTNSTNDVGVQLVVNDDPPGNAILRAKWAVLEHPMSSDADPPSGQAQVGGAVDSQLQTSANVTTTAQPQANTEVPEAFETIGEGEALESPGQSGVTLQVDRRDLILAPGKFYVHVHLCDKVANCEMHVRGPFVLDVTPPEPPVLRVNHVNANQVETSDRQPRRLCIAYDPQRHCTRWLEGVGTEFDLGAGDPQFFTDASRISLDWSGRPSMRDHIEASSDAQLREEEFIAAKEAKDAAMAQCEQHDEGDEGTCPNVVIAQEELSAAEMATEAAKQEEHRVNQAFDLQAPHDDPESGETWQKFRVYRVQTSDLSRTEVIAERDSSLLGNQPGALSEGLVDSIPADTMVLGDYYMVEVTRFNRAGLVTTYTSPHIMADWTPPKCTIPKFAQSDGVVQANTYPGGSSPSERYRRVAWMSNKSTSFQVLLDEQTCVDPESRIQSAKAWVESPYNNGVDIYRCAARARSLDL